jgi:hypothetical protein
MLIDWNATGSMLSGIGTLVGALAIIYAAHKGADTFRQWRKQKHHERCMAVAEDVLTLAYKLKRAFQAIRSPAIFGWEMSQLVQTLRENGQIQEGEEPGQLLITAQAALSRVDYNRPLFEALLDKLPVAKAILGDQVADWMDVLWKLRAKIVTSAQSYARYTRNLPTDSDAYRRQEERRERLEGILWEGGAVDEVDQIAIGVDEAITHLETELLPIIRDQMT